MPKALSAGYYSNIELRYILRQIARNEGTRVIFRKRFSEEFKPDGEYNSATQTISVRERLNQISILRTFFHELAHHVAVANKLWVQYHYDANNGQYTPEDMFCIENSIDYIASKLWTSYVCCKRYGKYRYAYPLAARKFSVNFLREYHLQ